MRALEVAIAMTGVSNSSSVVAAFNRIGASPRLAPDAESLARADFAVLPGVGAFGAAARALRERGMDEALRWRYAKGLPTLGICLGMQLFFEASEESPGVSGLGLLPGVVRRFRSAVRLPQLGWNRVGKGGPLLAEGWAYFANSFRVTEAPPACDVSRADYGESLIAALERGQGGGLLLCQYHPELSGPFGLSLLERWLAAGISGGPEAGKARRPDAGTIMAEARS